MADAVKWRAIGFDVVEINGHNPAELIEQIAALKTRKNGIPKVIIAHTIKGKGVSYMENRMEWHYLPMSDELYATAVSDVQQTYLLS